MVNVFLLKKKIFVLQNSKFRQISKSPDDIHTTLVTNDLLVCGLLRKPELYHKFALFCLDYLTFHLNLAQQLIEYKKIGP